MFNSVFYNQIDGAAMGSPVLANIFMGFHESKWLYELNLNKPKFYLRYVDEIQATFDNEQGSLFFFRITAILTLNSLWKNKLTIQSLFLMYSFQVSLIKISLLKYVTNLPI